MATIWQDIRYAFRLFGRERWFAAMAVLTLALGLGSTTAVFSVVNGVLLRSLAYAPSGRIVQVVQEFGREGTIGDGSRSLGSAIVIREVFDAWRASSTTIEGLAAFGRRPVTLVGIGDPVRLTGASVSPRLFALFGTRPLAGRLFEERESHPGSEPVMIISESLWRSRFGADPQVIGRRCTVDDQSITVIGVVPSAFAFPDGETALWLPFVETPPPPTVPGQRFVGGFWALAKLNPAVTIEQAEAEATVVARRVQSALGGFANANEDPTTISLVPLRERIVGQIRPALLVFLAAVGAVLLIATANLAQLLLARGTARAREMAVRSAIGASPARVIRQVLTENLLLSIAGGLLGVCFAYWLVRLLPRLAPATIPRLNEVSVDLRVLAFAAAASIVTAILIGILPSLRASRADSARVLADDSAAVVAGSRLKRHPARTLLLIGELAGTLVLMVGAALLIESFSRLVRVDPGYDPAHVVAAQLTLPSRYAAARRAAFWEELQARSAALPGVDAAGVTRSLPLTSGRTIAGFSLGTETPGSNAAARMNADLRIVSPGYFPAMGLRVREGRALMERDRTETPLVAVVNETFRRRFLPGVHAIGTMLRVARLDHVEIVGIVDDIHHAALTAPPLPEIYMSFRQIPAPPGGSAIVLRSSADPSVVISALRGIVRDIDASLPLESAMTMEERLAGSVAEPRFYMALLAMFATLAMGISIVGVYGVTAYNVAQRRREIGVRIALGARRIDVIRLVLTHSAIATGAALVIGLAGAMAATRVLQRFLFEVRAADVSSFTSAAILLALAALAGSYIPARRAAAVDPVEALRR
jgi:putative ABC transport system permease protein